MTSSPWSGAVDGTRSRRRPRRRRGLLPDDRRRRFDAAQIEQLGQGVLRAYRWQYIVSGAQHPRFLKLLQGMITQEQTERVTKALAPIASSLA